MSGKYSILIVDDEPDIGSLLREYLEPEFAVTTLTDSRIAVGEIAQNSYDLVISDVKMPHISGFELIRHIKAVCPQTSIVLITGHAQNGADRAEALGLGASGVLFKPFADPSKVIAYIKDILESQQA